MRSIASGHILIQKVTPHPGPNSYITSNARLQIEKRNRSHDEYELPGAIAVNCHQRRITTPLRNLRVLEHGARFGFVSQLASPSSATGLEIISDKCSLCEHSKKHSQWLHLAAVEFPVTGLKKS
jgi:hypothetical protein